MVRARDARQIFDSLPAADDTSTDGGGCVEEEGGGVMDGGEKLLDTSTDYLVLSNRNLIEEDFDRYMLPSNNILRSLDVSRNRLKSIPSQILSFSNLVYLDISRNSLQGLPPKINQLPHLVELIALSNNLRLRQLPLDELASLHHLRKLDLRYNRKLKQSALKVLQDALQLNNPQLEILCTVPLPATSQEYDGEPSTKKISACDRDATLLQSQLEPLSTPQLCKRLERSFNVILDKETDEAYDRDNVMSTLLQCYEKHGPRQIRYEKGTPISKSRIDALLIELEAIPWPNTTRERPKIRAEHYMILQKPGSGKSNSARTRRETAKLMKYKSLFDLAVDTLAEIDADFASRFTALAVTRNFVGSPHIDTLNIGPFYGLSLGEFNGGAVAVECSPFLVAEVDTRGRLGKLDGRFPHWVTPYEGTRYSLIYYVTSGNVEPQTTAIFPPKSNNDTDKAVVWIPPPTFVK